ncbi:MAG: ABC transporter permease subunit [Candidatus Nanopelagicales bacterium]|nr:ABC transporter permease subunit [Candidatus Nanopelagicales bacterium]
MIQLIAAEWIKATTTRAWWILFLVGVAITALGIVPIILAAGVQGFPVLTDASMMLALWSGLGSASVIALIIGITSVTGEYRHQTITDAFLTEPDRGRFMAAKASAQALVGAILGVVCTVMGIGMALALLPLREHAPIDWLAVLQAAAGVLLCFALFAILGCAFGALVTNQVAALVLALLWVMLVEPLIVAFLPSVGQWLPGGAASSVLGAGTTLEGAGLLPTWGGALVMLAYAVAFSALAVTTTLRRDIT